MSYDPSEGGGVVFSAYLATASTALPYVTAGGSYTFSWDSANQACSIVNNTVVCNHYASTATCDLATNATPTINAFAYGYKYSEYTGSHLYNTYAKGDDNAWGVHRDTNELVTDTKVIYHLNGFRNINGLDQFAGVII